MAAAVVAAAPLSAYALTPDCQAGVERAGTVAPLLVQPTVNGEVREVISARFLAPDGPLYVCESELQHWGISRTGDFGTMVFELVEHGELAKTEEDRLVDFQNVFDFEEAFGDAYRIDTTHAFASAS